MIDTGELNERVILRAPNYGDERVGQAQVTYSDGVTRWAKVRYLKQYEIVRLRQTDFRSEIEVTLRLDMDIDPDWKLRFRGDVYQVESVVHSDRTWTILTAYKVGE